MEEEARRAAESHGWEFETVVGSDRLVRGLIESEWEEADFVVVAPGQRIVATHDERILAATG